MLLEICASNFQSAINAQKAGAHRIEFCQDLPNGGITPNAEILKKVLSDIELPVFVLIRPRPGDFVYSIEEFEKMKADIQGYKKLGCHGIVSGVLKTNSRIDLERTHELIELSKPLPFTFHRAFDAISNPFDGLIELINIGATRLLTSGQQASAELGVKMLKKLLEISKNNIIILPGAGIVPRNALLFKEMGFQEIHASATMDDTVSKPDIITAILKSIYE